MDTINLLQKDNTQVVSSSPEAQNGIILTPDQQQVNIHLQNWCIDKQAKPGVFSGYAGVGKSTVLGIFVEAIKDKFPHWNIGMTAPTHKAVKVLKKFAYPDVEYRTLHSMLGLKEQVNEFTGEVTYAPDKYPKDPPGIAILNLLIIDEVSMLTDELFNYLIPWIKKGLKVLFCGDRAQIPPVRHKDCIPFLRANDWEMPQWNLTEVMRQKSGNPILEFATAIRNNQQTGHFTPQEHVLENGQGIKLVPHASTEEFEVLKTYFSDVKFKEDSDYMKVIAWRNNTVNKYNDIIRGIIYKDEPHLNDIMKGEKLLMDKPYILNARNILTRNEEIEVKSVVTCMKQLSYLNSLSIPSSINVKFYNIGVEWYTDKGTKHGNILVVHEDSKTLYLDTLESLKKYALSAPPTLKGKMWKQYYSMIEQSAWVKYNYAITAHCSQGSTYDNAMVLKWDIDANYTIEERNRILYVACTRARNTLFIEI